MKKLILIAALAALSGTAYADTQSDVFKCLKPFAATHPGAFYTDANGQLKATADGDDATRLCAGVIAAITHPYTARGTLILESGTIVDAVDMRPIPGLQKVVVSERMRLLQQRATMLFQRAEQLPPSNEKWDALAAAEQAEALMVQVAQCAMGLPMWLSQQLGDCTK